MYRGETGKIKDVKERAKKSIDKPPVLGLDLDISKFKFSSEVHEFISRDLEEKASSIGVDVSGKGRAGNYLQIDSSIVFEESSHSGIEIISISKALETYDWLLDYYWKALDVDMDKFTALSELKGSGGVFIRVKSGVKVELPVQACFYLKSSGFSQNVHNIIIVEENAELNVLTGCASPRINEGLHIGVSEFYVKKGGKLTYTMIHSWSEGIDVRPRTGVVLEDSASFINIYINVNPAKSIQTMPIVYLNGINSRASLISVVLASGNSFFDIGGAAYLKGDRSRAEITSKNIAKDDSKIISRGLIVGEGHECRGHLECRGLLLSAKSIIQAIPQLEARIMDATLSHEAAIGKLSEDEIYYLMAKGFNEDEAISIIIRGFMDIGIPDLPPMLNRYLKLVLDGVSKKL